MSRKTLVLDTECYSNYWLLMFKSVDSGTTRYYEVGFGQTLNVDEVKAILSGYRLVSFNGNGYDIPMIALALTGASTLQLKKASDRLIVNGMTSWDFANAYNLNLPRLDHIDLIEVAPGQGSLKVYGGRLHCKRLQDLPIEPNELIDQAKRESLITYCANDLDTTIDLFNALQPQLKLRETMSKEYGIDLRSKSDAQIAEAVIRREVENRLGERVMRPTFPPGTSFHYEPPSFLRYRTTLMRETLAMVCKAKFVIGDTGSVEMPAELAEAKIKIDQGVYRMGIGGLHSSEQCQAVFADDDHILIDRDVASYYPAIILNCSLYPQQMGFEFLHVYRGIVNRRLEAKKRGDKTVADSLKITINGSFGKLGSKWSSLYSPHLMIQVTVTGQLSLLMLIEALECEGIKVVSANTDGIVIRCPKRLDDRMQAIVADWEMATGFETEATLYKALYSRDVNNYVAIKPDGGAKTKGAYAPVTLQKNPANSISVEAAVEFLVKGTPLPETILKCRDLRKFITVRKVTGGALWRNQYLGRVVRWYYSVDSIDSIHYAKNGNLVPLSHGAMPVMTMPDSFPHDIDYGYYIDRAADILKDVGYVRRNG